MRAAARQLAHIHNGLRADLDRLRSGEALPARLADHCLAFCSALTAHHTGEDGLAFPYLEDASPDLKPTLDRLRREHSVVADRIRELRLLSTDPHALRERLDTLAGELDAHFRYEEAMLIPAIDALP
ncbi:hemerythrin domain-containing protein [Dactylosporangium sp. AC04546]|uniref:hemerythrin domain-containing protein n=1 Tax=Dactylosporangium sp. AC04546 TaxID=2862460 RepID=UPI002E7B67E4|nr:hemerythrin domain-containing protein [Dactylosporangium sp. AC04546]WVK84171.1 hemerythrin domain-containing protein [Dactylosporangium sp. AC04546]